MESVADSSSQKPTRVCQEIGCQRPLTHHGRNYCPQHRCLADVDFIRSILDSPEVRTARKVAQDQDRLERILRPVQRVEKQIRQAMAALPAPPPLSKIEREAKEAWRRFPEGDTEPLDFFIRERLGLIARKDKTPSHELRQSVWDLLDHCFKSVSGYVQGEWFLLGWEERQKLADLVRKKLMRSLILLRALSKGSGEVEVNLDKELPVAVTMVWDEMWDGGRPSKRGGKPLTFRNAVSAYLAEHAAIESSSLSNIPLEGAEHRSDYPHGVEDSFMAEFEAREETRQAAELVTRWVEEANFSPSERIVYEFDLRIGTDFATKSEATKAAARALKVKAVTVRGFRKRYHDKLRKVAGL